MGLLMLAALLILPLLGVITLYNRLVTLANRYKNLFSQVDIQLQRRYDLIPNLVEAARAYLEHEKDTLSQVTAARNQASDAARRAASNPGESTALAALNQADSLLNQSLGRLLAVSESYPDLKANDTVLSLMEELSSTENRVSFARQAYNDAVMEYNTAREQFPNNILNGAFGFRLALLFRPDAPTDIRQPLRISLR